MGNLIGPLACLAAESSCTDMDKLMGFKRGTVLPEGSCCGSQPFQCPLHPKFKSFSERFILCITFVVTAAL